MRIAIEEDDPDVIDGVYYPSEDGKSMSVTVVHVDTAVELFSTLKAHYRRADADVLVTLDALWYWERSNPKARISPDIMVCFGVPRETDRRCYIQWRENNVVPSVCFEFLSRGTWRKNLTLTKDFYERRGVREYFISDPDYKHVKSGLLGYRLKKGKYVEIVPEADGSMLSKSLNFCLLPVQRSLRLIDPKTGMLVPTILEEVDLERCKGEEKDRKIEEKDRKIEEKDRKIEEKDRKIEDERRRADELQQEVDRLRAQMNPKTAGEWVQSIMKR